MPLALAIAIGMVSALSFDIAKLLPAVQHVLGRVPAPPTPRNEDDHETSVRV
jgi:hypothetical protein